MLKRRREDSLSLIFNENFKLKFSFSYLFTQKIKNGVMPRFFIVKNKKMTRKKNNASCSKYISSKI